MFFFGGEGGYLRSICISQGGETLSDLQVFPQRRRWSLGLGSAEARFMGSLSKTQMVSLYFSRDASLRNYVLNLECATSSINVHYLASASAEGVWRRADGAQNPHRQVNLAQSPSTTDGGKPALSVATSRPAGGDARVLQSSRSLSACSATAQLARGLNVAFSPRRRFCCITCERSPSCPHCRSQSLNITPRAMDGYRSIDVSPLFITSFRTFCL